MRRACVRGFGNARTHLVDALERSFENWTWEDDVPEFGYLGDDFESLSKPLISVCGVRIKTAEDYVVVINEAPNCQNCLALSTSPIDRA